MPVKEDNRWLDLLGIMPINEDTLKAVYINDFNEILERSEEYSSLKFKYAISFSHPLIGAQYYDEQEWKQTLTFTLQDIEQSIYAGAPSIAGMPQFRIYEAVHCQFDSGKLDNALKSGDLGDILEIIPYQGQQFYSWGGDDEISLSRRSALRPLGIGYRLALLDDYLCWGSWTDGIKEMIDCYSNNVNSLADKEEYQQLAGALVDIGTVTAFFSLESQSLSSVKEWREQTPHGFNDDQNQRFVAATDGSVLLKPYRAYASGAGFDEKGFYSVIVILNPDNATARSNKSLLEQRINQNMSVWRGFNWSDLIEDMEITNEDKLTTAKLYGPIVEYWSSFDKWNGNYEPLLVSE